LVDEITVKCLELRAPSNSEEDARNVSARVDDGSIFGAIVNPSVRRSLLGNILKQQRLIPSLHTFCEDTKYLEPCANAIKRLLGHGLKGTVRNTMRVAFGQSLRGYADDCFEHRYRQLWAFAHRHFPELVNVAPRKELDRDKPTIKEPNPITWYRFAQLALDLGFMSDPMVRLRSQKKLEDSLRDFLVPITEHILDRKLVGQLVRQLRRTIVAKRDAGTSNEKPLIVDDKADVDLRHRCGRPYEGSQDEARRSLYTQWIYDNSSAKGRYVTHHYVHRAIFRAFFGEGSTPEVGTAVPGPEHDADRQTYDNAQQQNFAQGLSSLIHDWDSRSTVDESIRSASEALDDAIPMDDSADSHASLPDVFEAAQQPRSATAPREQSMNEGRDLSLIANWTSLNDSPIPFEPRLNLPDPVPMTIDRQLLEATDSSLVPYTSGGSEVTVAGPSSVSSSNVWQIKGVPLLPYPTGGSEVTKPLKEVPSAVAGPSSVSSSNVWQIKEVPLLPYPTGGSVVTVAEPSNDVFSSNVRQIKGVWNDVSLFAPTAAERPEKEEIEQTQRGKKANVEPEQPEVQLAPPRGTLALDNRQQRLEKSSTAESSPIAETPDPSPQMKRVLRRTDERRKLRKIPNKTIPVPQTELSPYVDQCPPPDLSTRSTSTQVLERHSKAVETVAAATAAATAEEAEEEEEEEDEMCT